MAVLQVLVEGDAIAGWLVEVNGEQGRIAMSTARTSSAEEAVVSVMQKHIEFTASFMRVKERQEYETRIKVLQEGVGDLSAQLQEAKSNNVADCVTDDLQRRAIGALMRAVLSDVEKITHDDIMDCLYGPKEIVEPYLTGSISWSKSGDDWFKTFANAPRAQGEVEQRPGSLSR